MDNIIVVKEMVHSLDKHIRDPLWNFLKIDIEKTYDTIRWNAILATLTDMHFPSKWIPWIMACASSASYFLLINGSPPTKLSLKDELGKGDPLSPYLFILIFQNPSPCLTKANDFR